MKNLIALCLGTLFGFGLAISGMTDTQKVIGFLDIFGEWQADLMFVMGFALLVTLIGYPFVLKQNTKPLFDSRFYLPTKTLIDKKLIGGAALFGVGWGLYGYCPGPAVASLAYLDFYTTLFVLSMVAGMYFVHFFDALKKRK